MAKRGISLIIIFLIILYPVSSSSIFPSNNIQYSNLVLEEVHKSNNIVQILVSNNYNYRISGLIITIDNQNIIINDQIDPYSSNLITFNIISSNPSTLKITSYIDINHQRHINKDTIEYRFNGLEQPIVNQEQINIIQQQGEQLEFNTRSSYISYSSISKLDDNKNIIYYTKDNINTNQITTNQQGDIVFRSNYHPFGSIFSSQGEERYKFSNKELDKSNLYYFGARYYYSDIGRFTQIDPILKLEESPYMYANNNPIKYIDPSGKQNHNALIEDAQQWASSPVIPGINEGLQNFVNYVEDYMVSESSAKNLVGAAVLWTAADLTKIIVTGANSWMGLALLSTAHPTPRPIRTLASQETIQNSVEAANLVGRPQLAHTIERFGSENRIFLDRSIPKRSGTTNYEIIRFNSKNNQEAVHIIGHEGLHNFHYESALAGNPISQRIIASPLADEYFAYKIEYQMGGEAALNIAAARGPQSFAEAYYRSWYGARDLASHPNLPPGDPNLYPATWEHNLRVLRTLQKFDE